MYQLLFSSVVQITEIAGPNPIEFPALMLKLYVLFGSKFFIFAVLFVNTKYAIVFPILLVILYCNSSSPPLSAGSLHCSDSESLVTLVQLKNVGAEGVATKINTEV